MGARAPVMVDHGGLGSKSDPAAGLAAAKICAVKLGMKRFGSAESPNRNLGVRRNPSQLCIRMSEASFAKTRGSSRPYSTSTTLVS